MPSAVCQRHGGALDRAELLGTMKRLLACLALCASLSASAQDDNCTVLGIQELTQMVMSFQHQLDSMKNVAMTRDSVVQISWLAQLSGVNLSGLNLGGAELWRADLSNALLIGTDFNWAYLMDADLSNSNLTSANFYFAGLTGANLTNANLTSASLINAGLDGANLVDANLSDANLSDANLSGADLSGADLSGATLNGATMTCLRWGCPSSLPIGYVCEPDSDCSFSNRYRVVPE